VGAARHAGKLGWLVVGLVALLIVGAAVPAGAVVLPDGRGYELVSPPDKNGGDVMASSGRVRAAADGSAATFASLGGFGDVQGSGVAFDYLARRTGTPDTSGWITHPLNPQGAASTLLATFNGVDSYYDGEFTPDLNCGVYEAVRPLPGVGDPADIPNLYLRDDLLNAGSGSYALLTVPLVPIVPSFSLPAVVAISDDCSHVLFQSVVPLTADTAPCTVNVDCRPKLYEWVDGTLRLAGILPDDTPAPDSVAGLGAGNHYTLGMLSADGSRVFFAVPSTGNVYMRENGTPTVQLNAGLPAGQYSLWVVSADGNRAFFSDGVDLYRYDTTAPTGRELTLITTDEETRDGGHSIIGVLGVSADGDSIYFFAAGQLVAGEPLLGAARGLYAWRNGELRFIGETAGATDTAPDSLDTPPGFETLSSRVSTDGSHVLFMTHSSDGFRDRWGFPGYDHGHSCSGAQRCRELYLFDADAGSLVCVSCNPSGATATANAFVDASTGTGASNRPVHVSHALSANGQRAFFYTAEALLPEDSNGHSDVYEYDAANSSLHLISSGKDPGNSYFMDATANGDDVFFATREQLVGWDTDQNYDLYDARVGGGLPNPAPAPPACTGETCQGQPTTNPTPDTTASNTGTGTGNVRPHRTKKHHANCTHKTKHHKHRCSRRKRVRRASAHSRSAK
jgi:hypothetical protein